MKYRFRQKIIAGFFKSLTALNKAWVLIKKVNHFLKSIEVILVIVALFFAYEAYLDTKEQLKISKMELKANSLNNAWAILAARVPGNSGKVAALELLAKEQQDLYGIDMSEVIDVGRKDLAEDKNSLMGAVLNPSAIYLVDLNLSLDNIGYQAKLTGAKFSGANLLGANFSGSDLTFANFKEADLEGASFRGAHISGANFKGIKYFGKIDFEDSYVFAKDSHDTKLLPKFDERFLVKLKEDKTYRVTTTDEKKLISDQVAKLDKKIKTEKDQNILTKLEEQKTKLLSDKWLKEDPNGKIYKIEITPQILY
jgi:hypothetical protein